MQERKGVSILNIAREFSPKHKDCINFPSVIGGHILQAEIYPPWRVGILQNINAHLSGRFVFLNIHFWFFFFFFSLFAT
jgi:hypothetical protein